MINLSEKLVTVEAVTHTHTHTDSLENNKKVNIKDKVILSCVNLGIG